MIEQNKMHCKVEIIDTKKVVLHLLRKQLRHLRQRLRGDPFLWKEGIGALLVAACLRRPNRHCLKIMGKSPVRKHRLRVLRNSASQMLDVYEPEALFLCSWRGFEREPVGIESTGDAEYNWEEVLFFEAPTTGKDGVSETEAADEELGAWLLLLLLVLGGAIVTPAGKSFEMRMYKRAKRKAQQFVEQCTNVPNDSIIFLNTASCFDVSNFAAHPMKPKVGIIT